MITFGYVLLVLSLVLADGEFYILDGMLAVRDANKHFGLALAEDRREFLAWSESKTGASAGCGSGHRKTNLCNLWIQLDLSG